MTRNSPRVAIVAASLLGVCSSPAAAADMSVNGILTTALSSAVAAERLTCMFGEEPDRVTAGRKAGKQMPDAADTCVAVLIRTAREGRLVDLYRTVLTQLGGRADGYEKLPAAIAAAVMDGDGKVSLGNGKAADVPPPLAFDAGFTFAYQRGDRRAGNTDPVQLKALTEACLAVKKDAATCFSAGYANAGRVLSGAN